MATFHLPSTFHETVVEVTGSPNFARSLYDLAFAFFTSDPTISAMVFGIDLRSREYVLTIPRSGVWNLVETDFQQESRRVHNFLSSPSTIDRREAENYVLASFGIVPYYCERNS